MCTLLSDVVYCRDRAGSIYAQSLDHSAFIDKFAKRLPEVFCDAYRNRALVLDEERNFEQFRVFIMCFMPVFERNFEMWASPNMKTWSHGHTSTIPWFHTLSKHQYQTRN